MPDNEIIHNAISELRNRWNFSCDEILDGVETIYGRSSFDPAIRRKANRRVDDIQSRPKRKKHPRLYYQHLYDHQNGDCIRFSKRCTGRLVTPANSHKNHLDHIDPNASPDTWDTRVNHQLICDACNLEKSSMSIMDQAKHTGRGIAEIIRNGLE